MKILIATFDHNYYLWQVLVQINNFMKYGYDADTVYVVSSSNPSPVSIFSTFDFSLCPSSK